MIPFIKGDCYNVECILRTQDISVNALEESLKGLGQGLKIIQLDEIKGNTIFKIKINTQQPEILFDTCCLFGRLDKIIVNKLDKEA